MWGRFNLHRTNGKTLPIRLRYASQLHHYINVQFIVRKITLHYMNDAPLQMPDPLDHSKIETFGGRIQVQKLTRGSQRPIFRVNQYFADKELVGAPSRLV